MFWNSSAIKRGFVQQLEQSAADPSDCSDQGAQAEVMQGREFESVAVAKRIDCASFACVQ